MEAMCKCRYFSLDCVELCDFSSKYKYFIKFSNYS